MCRKKNPSSSPRKEEVLRFTYKHPQSSRKTTPPLFFRGGVTAQKGTYTAYGAASASKDERLIDSLLELAETRAIARDLRFCGIETEYTGLEELPDNSSKPSPNKPSITPFPITPYQQQEFIPATRPQIHAIEKISTINRWDAVECCRRILHKPSVSSLDDISKDDASEVIGRMKEAA